MNPAYIAATQTPSFFNGSPLTASTITGPGNPNRHETGGGVPMGGSANEIFHIAGPFRNSRFRDLNFFAPGYPPDSLIPFYHFRRRISMTVQTRLLSIFCMAITLVFPFTVAADSKTLPGIACQPVRNNQLTYHELSGAINNAETFNIGVHCPILREKTTDAPILKASIKVLNPAGASDTSFFCLFNSLRPNGDLVQSKTVVSSKAGLQNLTVRNLKTVANGMVLVGCIVPPDGEIRWIFWDE